MNRSSMFPYDLAFDRNLGWITEPEQLALRAKRVAIAGMGGVGGVHLLTLARLGIGGFTIADFDTFEYANFNRQIGATLATLGRAKAEVLEEMALAINPELRIRRFDAGVARESVDGFLAGVDLFVDGLDFFEIDIRRRIFARCRDLGIPAVTAAPIGMGTGYLVFTPRGMSFEDYFRFEGCTPEEQFLRFLMGLVPRGLHRAYLMDPTRINLAAHKGPSTAAAVQLCAGTTAAAAVKLLLGRPGVKPAPWHHQFDAYRDKMATSRLRWGLAGPTQRAKLAIARRAIGRTGGARLPADPPAHGRSPIEEILNLGRWAPSGDNAQPWRFRILDEATVSVRLLADTTDIYEYRDGEPSRLAAGMLLETLRIAATGWRRDMSWEVDATAQEIVVRLPPTSGIDPDPLLSFVTLRTVDRRPFQARRLAAGERLRLEQSVGGVVPVEWHESLSARWRIARMSGRATDIRLRCPECFPIHQRIIDWTGRLSPQGIPACALGVGRVPLRLLRWGLTDWVRMQRLNHIAGTWGTAMQTDTLPGLLSGAYLVAKYPPSGGDTLSLLRAGQGLQRLWLTATQLGLAMQPMLAPLAFAHYGETEAPFTADARLREKAKTLADEFRRTIGVSAAETVFLARIGEPRQGLPSCRSTRLPLADLIEADASPLPA